jgi:hypothetical protein
MLEASAPDEMLASRGDWMSDAISRLHNYAVDRHPDAPPRDPAVRRPLLEDCCTAISVDPGASGADAVSTGFEADPALGEAGDLPEWEVCNIWKSCCRGVPAGDSADRLAVLVGVGLWPPVLGLAYRALVCLGRRDLLAKLLPADGILTLAQADAWLDAVHGDGPGRNCRLRIAESEASPLLPNDVCASWRTLLDAELELAFGSQPAIVEDALTQLLKPAAYAEGTYAYVEAHRIRGRAAAALVRLALIAGVPRPVPDDGALPLWETWYLKGLMAWRAGDVAGAETMLRDGLASSPNQGCVRLALASLLSESAPEAALAFLDGARATRQAHVVRASLLARLKSYDEAGKALAAAGGSPFEQARSSWTRGLAQSLRLENSLCAALAEREHRWNDAETAWGAVCSEGDQRALRDSRRLYVDHCRLEALPAEREWERSTLANRLGRRFDSLGGITLRGNAAFFRAVAALERWPERSADDLKALIDQRRWVRRECRAGGNRIRFVADALLRLGHARHALRAFELLPPSQWGLGERRSVAALAAAISEQNDTAVIMGLFGDPSSHATCWPGLLAALAMALQGERSGAAVALAGTAKDGAPEAVRSILHAIVESKPVAAEHLACLRLPDETAAAVRMICSPGTIKAEAIREYVSSVGGGWLERCPLDPPAVARTLMAALWAENKWPEAVALAARLEKSGRDWAVEIATLTRVRNALAMAIAGKLDGAESALLGLLQAGGRSGRT